MVPDLSDAASTQPMPGCAPCPAPHPTSPLAVPAGTPPAPPELWLLAPAGHAAAADKDPDNKGEAESHLIAGAEPCRRQRFKAHGGFPPPLRRHRGLETQLLAGPHNEAGSKVTETSRIPLQITSIW